MRLLEDSWVTPEYTDVHTVSREPISRTLKNEIKPWQNRERCIPPEANAEFVACMEDVLDVYGTGCKAAAGLYG
jgi:hypothetical protein